MLKVNTSTPSSATAYISPSGYAPRSVAVDKENDLIFANNFNSSAVEDDFCLGEAGTTGPANTGSGDCTFLGTSSTGNILTAANWLALDSSQNLWVPGLGDTTLASGSYPGYGGQAFELLDTGSSGAPAYSGSWKRGLIGGGSSGALQNNSAPYGIALDSSGNAWITTDAPVNGGTQVGVVGLTKANMTSGSLATSTSSTLALTSLGLVVPKWLEADGNNVMWVADTGGIVAYSTTASPNVAEISESGGFRPCLAGSGTTCSYPDNSSTKGIAIDSTGSVWFTTPDSTTSVANSNRLVQIIGTASSAWPLLATGKPGVMPQ